MKTTLYSKIITLFPDKWHIIKLSRPEKETGNQSDSHHMWFLCLLYHHQRGALLYLVHHPHTNTKHTQLQPLTAPPALPQSHLTLQLWPQPSLAQRQAKCMLMRARPMLEPHSFWEEMAFNNGGPRGDFAQSSAPLWKIHSIHRCACALLLSCSLFHQKKKIKRRENGLRIHLWPSRPCIYAGGRRTFGECRELWFFFITPLVNVDIVKLHLALPPCLSLLLCLRLCWDKCPRKHANCTTCISNRWYPLGLWAQKYFKEEYNR